MARHRTFLFTAAPLALVLALGVAACSEAERDEAAAEAQAAAENVAAAADEMIEEAGQAAEEAADRIGEATRDALDAADDAVDSFRTEAPSGARVYFANLEDGDTVSSPVTILFGAENIGVTAAGDQTDGTGHHHLLIDATLDDLDMDMPIPNDVNHMHFGMAQTEATVELAPGEHTLQLVMGDWTHIPHEPVVASDVITITVQ